MNKVITQLSEEELIKALETNEEVEQVGHELVDFISIFNLKTGSTKVPFKQIKKLYCEWSKEQENLTKLHSFLSERFSIIHGYVMLENSPINIAQKRGLKIQSRVYDKMKKNKYHEQFNKFLEQNNIKSGEWFIADFILYHFYDKWSFETKQKNHINQTLFNKFCSHNFIKKRIKNNLYFKINENYIVTLDKKTIENVKRKKEESQKQKKLDKKSGSKETI